MDDEELGRMVRAVWINWALWQPNPKPSWLVPWEYLTESEREVDRRIGRRLFQAGVDFERGRPWGSPALPATPPAVERCPIHQEPVGDGRSCIACAGGVF